MQLGAVIERVWRGTRRPWLSEFGGRNRASGEIHLEAAIERVWRCTWRPWSSEIRGVLGGSRSGGGSSRGRRDGSWDSIHRLTHNCGNVENWVHHGLPKRWETGWERETVDLGMMQYAVYAVLGVNSWSWHGEIDTDDLTSCSQVMVELRTRKREMRRYGGNHHEKLGLRRISCASQFTIPDTAGMSPDPQCNYSDTRSSQPDQAIRTPNFSYSLISSTSFSSSSPISLFLLHNFTIIAKHKVKSSLSISPCHDHEFTPRRAYTEYSVQCVQHPPTIVCLPFIFMITSWPLDVASASGVPPWSTAISRFSPWELKGKVTLSHSHSWELTNWRIESQHLARCSSSALKHSSKLAQLGPPSSHDNGLPVHLLTRLMTGSKFAQSWLPNASTISLDHNLGVHL